MRSLWACRQRSILALLAIAMGVASVIALINIGTTVEREATRQFETIGTDFAVIEFSPGPGHSPLREQLGPSAITDLANEVQGMERAAPISETQAIAMFRGVPLEAQVIGMNSAGSRIHQFPMAQGRMVTDADRLAQYCVLGEVVAAQMRSAGLENPIEATLSIQGRLYRVIGILQPTDPGFELTFDPNQAVILPIEAANHINGDRNTYRAHARIDPRGDLELLQDQINRFLQFRTDGWTGQVTSARTLIRQMRQQAELFSFLLIAMGTVALLVGGVGVMNVMLVSLSERKVEIGVRRALGALQSEIRIQFLWEAFILCLVGAALGIALGISISYITAALCGWSFQPSLTAVIIGVAVSCALALFFGYYPARQASRLDVISCLRGG